MSANCHLEPCWELGADQVAVQGMCLVCDDTPAGMESIISHGSTDAWKDLFNFGQPLLGSISSPGYVPGRGMLAPPPELEPAVDFSTGGSMLERFLQRTFTPTAKPAPKWIPPVSDFSKLLEKEFKPTASPSIDPIPFWESAALMFGLTEAGLLLGALLFPQATGMDELQPRDYVPEPQKETQPDGQPLVDAPTGATGGDFSPGGVPSDIGGPTPSPQRRPETSPLQDFSPTDLVTLPLPEPNLSPKPVPGPDFSPSPDLEPFAQPQPEPQTEPKPFVDPEIWPWPSPEPQTLTQPKPVENPWPWPEPQTLTQPEPTRRAQPQPQPKPVTLTDATMQPFGPDSPPLTSNRRRPVPWPGPAPMPDKNCECKPKRKEKQPKKPREVCRRGVYIERSFGLTKYPGRVVKCR